MPKRSSNKRPRDPNALAAEIVAEAIAEKPAVYYARVEPKETVEVEAKNPAAVALGRLGGKKGGKARARKLSAKRRREIARKAARARWKKRKEPAKPVGTVSEVVLSRFDDLAARLSRGESLRVMREQLEAEIVAERGQEWVDQNKAMLDADWNNALETLGFGLAEVQRGKPASP